MSTAAGIVFLLVYVLGAFAYGSALMLSLRQASPVWSPHRHHGTALRPRLDRASIAMFAWSAVWFVVLALDQFDEFVNGPRRNVLDLAQLFLVFGFPPLIVHTMYLEAHVPSWPGRARTWATGVLAACTSPRHWRWPTAMSLVFELRAGRTAGRLHRRLPGGALHDRRPLLGGRHEPQPAGGGDHRASADAAGAERPVRGARSR